MLLEAGRRLLLVDDEEVLVATLSARLEESRPELQVEVAYDAESALERLRTHSPALLVSDVRLPRMSGSELVVEARRHLPSLPVILMTGGPAPDLGAFGAASATNFLEKPFEFEAFLDLVDRALAPVGFSGAISVQTLPDIVQLYALSSATGALRVVHRSEVGEIWFEGGAITHAATEHEAGESAFFRIMRWRGGEFSVRMGVSARERSITTSWTELVMESCRRNDEQLRDETGPRPSKSGWTVAPPPMSDPEERPPDSMELDFELYTQQRHVTEEERMNIKESLAKLNVIDGFVGAALVDAESGMLLGSEGGGGLNLEVAAAGNTEVVKAKRKTMSNLNLKGEAIEDILITLNKQYHLIRPMRSRPTLFFYVALERSRANLAMARITVADVEKDLQV